MIRFHLHFFLFLFCWNLGEVFRHKPSVIVVRKVPAVRVHVVR